MALVSAHSGLVGLQLGEKFRLSHRLGPPLIFAQRRRSHLLLHFLISSINWRCIALSAAASHLSGIVGLLFLRHAVRSAVSSYYQHISTHANISSIALLLTHGAHLRIAARGCVAGTQSVCPLIERWVKPSVAA